MITDDEAVELLYEMVAIPSPSGGEAKLAGYLCDRLAGLGFDSRIDEVGNVIADIGTGDGPTLMLLSHLDTVDGPIPAHRDRTTVYGRGSVDAKGPLAAMVCAAARRADFPGTLRIAAAVEEERLARGGHHIAATQPAPDLLLVGEPGGTDSVVLGYKGKLDLTYEVRCAATHSTNPVPKAGELAVAFWAQVGAALGGDLDHGSFHRPAATLRSLTATMEHALLDVDCRLPPGFDVEAFRSALDPGTGELTIHRWIPAVRAARTNPLARALSAGIRRTGGTPRPTLKTGTSDMNTVAPSWPSLPMAAYGPGNATLDHSPTEHLPIADYLRAIAVLTHTVDELSHGLESRRHRSV